MTGKITAMDINISEDQMKRHADGALIQNVAPRLTSDEREFIITGMTQDDWEEMFGAES